MVDNPTIQDLNEQVDDLKGVMKDNIGKVIDRGDKLETLQTRAEDLEQNVSGRLHYPTVILVYYTHASSIYIITVVG